MIIRFFIFLVSFALVSFPICANDLLINNLYGFNQNNLCSPAGIRQFIKEVLNKDEYRKEILPHNFVHFQQLFIYGEETKKDNAYFQAVIRLLTNTLKASPYINPEAFSELLETVKAVLTPLCSSSSMAQEEKTQTFKNAVYSLLVNSLNDFFSLFQQQGMPIQQHLKDVAEQVIVLSQTESALVETVHLNELRKVTLLLLETALAKLIWAPGDDVQTWQITKKVAHQLMDLAQENIIDDIDDLNGLLITLVQRYAFFIELMGSRLSSQLYQHIKSDIASQSVLFLEIAEQEDGLISKAEILTNAILQAEVTQKAFQLS